MQINIQFKSKLKPAPEFRPAFNVGALLDLPIAEFYNGKHGEYIISGGQGNMTAVSGPGNSNKSTLTDYMNIQTLDRLVMTCPTVYGKYETEITGTARRVEKLTKHHTLYLKNIDIIGSGLYLFTNKTTMPGEEYYSAWKDGLESKTKDKLALQKTPFIKRDGSNHHMVIPTLDSIDSITDFTTNNTDELMIKHDLGDSKQNRLFMVQGRDKSNMLLEMPVVTDKYANYMTITTHTGKKAQEMGQGPARPPSKSNTFMKADERIKGLTEKAYYMFSAYWMTSVSRTYYQDGTKFLRYPKDQESIVEGDMDLQTTNITLIRGKGGVGSGANITLVVSQQEGVIPYLTELDYCRERDNWGIVGNATTWALELLPDIKMTRNTARTKFDNSYALQRAMNITSEIAQCRQYFRTVFPWIPESMTEIINGVKANGYDIEFLLENTRGWWTLNEEQHPLKYLCFLDFVRMGLGTYHPYWLEDDKKTIKKEYIVNNG